MEKHSYTASSSTHSTDHVHPHAVSGPVASDVAIVGEPIVGGTVKGSYRYSDSGNRPERNSEYVWIVNGQHVSYERELRIVEGYEGKEIRFLVTPVNVDDVSGDKTASDPKVSISGFQNITDEENQNSFMKQHGNYSFYTPEPADRIFVSTGGAFSLVDAGSQDVFIHGQNDYGAVVPAAIQVYLKNNPAAVMFSTERDFAAIVPLNVTTNQLIAWGRNIPANIDFTQYRGIRAVYANRGAFAYIFEKPNKDNKWIGAIGAANHGGTVPDAIHLKLVNDPPRAIYATLDAFAVLTSAGKVYAWGSANGGGTISKEAEAYLSRMSVTRIISNASAFCAIDGAGEFVPWGAAANGGTIPPARLGNILSDGGVKSIIASRAAFCAITRISARAVSWGNPTQGGDMHAAAERLALGGQIIMCRAATWAFCMVNAKGLAEAWGVANSGGTIPDRPYTTHAEERSIYGAASMRGLFNGSGAKQAIHRLFLRKMQEAGINIENEHERNAAAERFSKSFKRITPNTRVEDGLVSILANDSSFFLIAQDEHGLTTDVLAWGQANGGGQIPADVLTVLQSSVVTGAYCTNGAYGVISNQNRVKGVVNVWGATLAQQDAGEIPKVPPEIAQKLSKGIVEIYSIKREPPVNPTPTRVDPSFAARHEDGSYVLWGGNVTNQVFIPEDQGAALAAAQSHGLLGFGATDGHRHSFRK